MLKNFKKISRSELIDYIKQREPDFNEKRLDNILSALFAVSKKERPALDKKFQPVERNFIYDTYVKYKSFTDDVKNKKGYEKAVKLTLKEYSKISKDGESKMTPLSNKIQKFSKGINVTNPKKSNKITKGIVYTSVAIAALFIGSYTYLQFSATQSWKVKNDVVKVEHLTKKQKNNISVIYSFKMKNRVYSVVSGNVGNSLDSWIISGDDVLIDSNKPQNSPLIVVQVIDYYKNKVGNDMTINSVSIKDDVVKINNKSFKVERVSKNNFVVKSINGDAYKPKKGFFLNQNGQRDLLKKLKIEDEELSIKSFKINSYKNLEVLFTDSSGKLYTIVTNKDGKVQGSGVGDKASANNYISDIYNLDNK